MRLFHLISKRIFNISYSLRCGRLFCCFIHLLSRILCRDSMYSCVLRLKNFNDLRNLERPSSCQVFLHNLSVACLQFVQIGTSALPLIDIEEEDPVQEEESVFVEILVEM